MHELYNSCIRASVPPMSRSRSIKRISASEARANLADLLESVGEGNERVLIERRGKSPVALVSVDDLLTFELLEGLRVRREPKR
jgi:prevent-host-death family protein